ncbi:MAG: hypothetical protein II240_04445 [Bacteroidaceae bacterium]|nr:hypothetical protein [Bacteroidaceae bacterium]
MIKLKGGEQVELLATPALFAIAKRRGMTIEADADNAADVFSAYTKLIYLAALNAWEVRRYDAPQMGECHYRLMDFVEWASGDAEAFVKAVNFILVALTGKELKDYNTGEEKAPENEEKDEKKKSTSSWTTRLLRRS